MMVDDQYRGRASVCCFGFFFLIKKKVKHGYTLSTSVFLNAEWDALLFSTDTSLRRRKS